jgi:hypothetical protein
MSAEQAEAGRRLGALRSLQSRLIRETKHSLDRLRRVTEELSFLCSQTTGSTGEKASCGSSGTGEISTPERELLSLLNLSSSGRTGEEKTPPSVGLPRARARTAPRTAPQYDAHPGFLRFWSVWPKKHAKEEALAVWVKLDPDDALTDRIIQTVREHLATDWAGKDPQYIKNPDAWLRRKRWEDEILAPSSARPRGQAQRAFDVYIAEELEKERHEQGTNGTHRPEAL